MEVILAVAFGTLFGFALNRAGATNPQVIINMLRLTDTHLLRVMLLAVSISSGLLFAGLASGLVDPGNLSVKTLYWGVPAGGILLGIGWALAGYCPRALVLQQWVKAGRTPCSSCSAGSPELSSTRSCTESS